MTNLMLITLQTLASFTLIFILTAGGPGEASQTTPLYIYQQALQLYNISYGTAMCLVLLLVGALFLFVYIQADAGRRYHRDWVTKTYGPALATLPPATRHRKLAQLTAVTDLATWRLLRRELGLSPHQTTAAIRELVDACLP